MAAIAWAGWWAYRRYALDLDALPHGYRALLYAAIGAIVLVLAGAGKLTATTPGALAFIAAARRRRSSRSSPCGVRTASSAERRAV